MSNVVKKPPPRPPPPRFPPPVNNTSTTVNGTTPPIAPRAKPRSHTALAITKSVTTTAVQVLPEPSPAPLANSSRSLSKSLQILPTEDSSRTPPTRPVPLPRNKKPARPAAPPCSPLPRKTSTPNIRHSRSAGNSPSIPPRPKTTEPTPLTSSPRANTLSDSKNRSPRPPRVVKDLTLNKPPRNIARVPAQIESQEQIECYAEVTLLSNAIVSVPKNEPEEIPWYASSDEVMSSNKTSKATDNATSKNKTNPRKIFNQLTEHLKSRTESLVNVQQQKDQSHSSVALQDDIYAIPGQFYPPTTVTNGVNFHSSSAVPRSINHKDNESQYTIPNQTSLLTSTEEAYVALTPSQLEEDSVYTNPTCASPEFRASSSLSHTSPSPPPGYASLNVVDVTESEYQELDIGKRTAVLANAS